MIKFPVSTVSLFYTKYGYIGIIKTMVEGLRKNNESTYRNTTLKKNPKRSVYIIKSNILPHKKQIFSIKLLETNFRLYMLK